MKIPKMPKTKPPKSEQGDKPMIEVAFRYHAKGAYGGFITLIMPMRVAPRKGEEVHFSLSPFEASREQIGYFSGQSFKVASVVHMIHKNSHHTVQVYLRRL